MLAAALLPASAVAAALASVSAPPLAAGRPTAAGGDALPPAVRITAAAPPPAVTVTAAASPGTGRFGFVAPPVAASAAAANAVPTVLPITVTDDDGRRLTLPRPPRRVVSLLPSLTETVCALNACARLVGTDRHSNWPAQVSALPKLGGLEDAQIERIVALKPDLVLTASSSRAVDRLHALGLPVLALEPQDEAATRRTVATVAQALGDPAAGTALLAALDARTAAAAARVPAAWHGRTVYFEVSATPYAAGAASFIGELLSQMRLVNIVPASMGPFPQLNPEFVLRAQPAVVMAGAQALADMPRRPGWSGLRALRLQRLCSFKAAAMDSLVRPGPRRGEAADAVADCLVALPAPLP